MPNRVSRARGDSHCSTMTSLQLRDRTEDTGKSERLAREVDAIGPLLVTDVGSGLRTGVCEPQFANPGCGEFSLLPARVPRVTQPLHSLSIATFCELKKIRFSSLLQLERRAGVGRGIPVMPDL
jgi:hypothetical protein